MPRRSCGIPGCGCSRSMIFEAVEIAALWSGEPTARIRALLEEAQRYVTQQWPGLACGDKLA